MTARLSAAWLLNGKAVIHETLAERARLAKEAVRRKRPRSPRN